MADLYINGKDALEEFGVRMGDGFLDAIGAPLPMKENIENSSRLKHGKEVLILGKIDSRQLTLEFTLCGSSQADYREKKQKFLTTLYSGSLTISIPAESDEVFRLIYLGNSPSYGQSRNRCFCRMAVKFEEPDPTDRK